MPDPTTDSLHTLLEGCDDASRQRAWTAFLQEHTALILHVARSQGGDHDAVMDRYLFVIQALEDNDCHRLRGYADERQCSFTTWLRVVARRLCFDQHRARYGRPQSDTNDSVAQHVRRRQLTDLVGVELHPEMLEAAADESPEEQCRRLELRSLLERALAGLAPGERLLLRLRFEDGLSVPEIARLMGEDSPFPLYRRLDKLLGRLRNSLTAAGVDNPVP